MIKIFVIVGALIFIAWFIVNKQDTIEGETEGTTAPATQNAGNAENPESVTKEVKEKPEINSSKVLDLSGQGLTKTPSYVFDKTSIQELDLSDNKLEGSLQAEVRHLQNLKILDLSHNQFTGVPAEIGQLKNLEILNLSNNKLTGLPYELGNLSNLKILNLKGNDYSKTDLELIREKLPVSTIIEID